MSATTKKLATVGLTLALTTSLAVTSSIPAQASSSQPMAASSATVSADLGSYEKTEPGTQAVPILAIIGAVIAVGGSYYGMGQVAGERAYYAGLRNAEYQSVKWHVRAYVTAACGVVGGPIFMTGFENKFYSLASR